jgi:hypothetical protein
LFFILAVHQEKKTIVEDKDIELVVGYVRKVKGIRDVLSRDHMKVAFFGRYFTFHLHLFFFFNGFYGVFF